MRLRLLTAGTLAALALAGCGGSSGAGTDGTTGAQAAPDGTATTGGAACSASVKPADPNQPRSKPKVTTTPGPAPAHLVVKDVIPGSGRPAKAGDTVTVQYVGVLCRNGKQFDASWDRGESFSFPLGGGQVIRGWDQGLVGMKPGGRRLLIIPPGLGYGDQSSGPRPANSTLVFVVDLERLS
jgi:peptidylprolyl isomerase